MDNIVNNVHKIIIGIEHKGIVKAAVSTRSTKKTKINALVKSIT